MKCLIAFMLIVSFLASSEAFECQNSEYETIKVDQSGKGDFKTVQKALDSIPSYNNKWIRVLIAPGTFREKVTIASHKPCIFLQGAGTRFTTIEWNDATSTSESATFTAYPDNILVEGITFKNFYNIPPGPSFNTNNKVKQAVAARIYGDKSAFHHCAFFGLQDTLWDAQGRHYFKNCYIEGGIDFIFGRGQSIYQSCLINLNIGKYAPQYPSGFITAQARNSSDDPSGFVFKSCLFQGTGKADLGRAYGGYSRVIIYDSELSDSILPVGWYAWHYVKEEENLMYAEHGCQGPGANTSKRVPWMKKLNASQLIKFVNISYIDKEGWMDKQPKIYSRDEKKSNINASLILINQRPHTSPFRGSGNFCTTCDRCLQHPYLYCSLSSKVNYVLRTEYGVFGFSFDCNFLDLPDVGSDDGLVPPEPSGSTKTSFGSDRKGNLYV